MLLLDPLEKLIGTELAGVARRAAPPRRELRQQLAAPQNVVIVKLNAKSATVRRMAATAAESSVDTSQSLLGRVIESGYVREVRTVFEGHSEFALPSATSRQPHAAPMRIVALAARPAAGLNRRSSGLCALEVAPGMNAEMLANDLSRRTDEVEYAYVPPVKYPTAKKSSGQRKAKPSTAKKRKSSPQTTKPRRKRAKATTPNDPMLSRQWSHAAIELHRARQRKGFNPGSKIVVAVVDSGIDEDHPDLKPSIHSYTNYLAATEDGRDYVGHGTHVAGIVAAAVNNRIGIAGVCDAQIMAIKALPRRGNSWNAEKYYQALGHPMDHGAQILNLSLGGGFDPGERDIIQDLIAAGVIVVAAMGNEFEEGNPTSFPAAYDDVIAVGATDEADRRADFSCTGPHIDLCAPGVNILSTVPRYPSEFADTVDYDSWPGTSMATPLVAAAIALLLAKDNALTHGDIAQLLRQSADLVPGQLGWDEAHGAGRLNVYRALTS